VDIEINRVYHNDRAGCDLRVVPIGRSGPEHHRYQIEAFPSPQGGWARVWRCHNLDEAAEQLAIYLQWGRNPAEQR
jgi:hypothetical protein